MFSEANVGGIFFEVNIAFWRSEILSWSISLSIMLSLIQLSKTKKSKLTVLLTVLQPLSSELAQQGRSFPLYREPCLWVMGCVVNDIHNLVVASNDISVQGDALFSVEVASNS